MRVRQYIAVLALALSVACDQVIGETSPFGQGTGLIGPQEFDPQFVALLKAKAPALQIGIIDREVSSIMLREAHRDGRDTWLSPDGLSLTTQSGMLLATRGFGGELLASDVSDPLAMVLAGREGWSDRLHTFLQGDDRAVTRTYRCKIERSGAREVQLRTRTVATQLMRESCRSLDQSFFNLFWVDQSRSTIIQSRQWAGDHVGPISTRIVEN